MTDRPVAPALTVHLDQRQWSLLDRGNPGGVQMATLWGDPASGPFGALLKVPAGLEADRKRHVICSLAGRGRRALRALVFASLVVRLSDRKSNVVRVGLVLSTRVNWPPGDVGPGQSRGRMTVTAATHRPAAGGSAAPGSGRSPPRPRGRRPA